MNIQNNVLTMQTIQIPPIRHLSSALKYLVPDLTMIIDKQKLKIINYDKNHTDQVAVELKFEKHQCIPWKTKFENLMVTLVFISKDLFISLCILMRLWMINVKSINVCCHNYSFLYSRSNSYYLITTYIPNICGISWRIFWNSAI